MKYNNLISVIIPCYNAANTILETVSSVLNQHYSNLEIILVDDGSTDTTIETIKSISDTRITLLQQKNGGAAKARNYGVQHASGELICFLDADDLWVPTKLEKQLTVLQSETMIYGLVQEFTDLILIEEENKKNQNKIYTGYSPITLMMYKNDFMKVGLFNENYSVAEFIDWLDRAKSLGIKENIIPEILAYRRIHKGNIDRLKRDNVKQYAAVIKAALDRKRNS